MKASNTKSVLGTFFCSRGGNPNVARSYGPINFCYALCVNEPECGLGQSDADSCISTSTEKNPCKTGRELL